MKLGVFTPVFANWDLDQMLAKVRALQHVEGDRARFRGLARKRHLNVTAPRHNRVLADFRRTGGRRADDQRAVVSQHVLAMPATRPTGRLADETRLR